MRQKIWSSTFWMISFGFGVALWWLVESILRGLQQRDCPAGSFISGSLHWSALLTHFPPVIVSVAVVVLVMTGVFYLLPWSGAKRAALGSFALDLRSSILLKFCVVAGIMLIAAPVTAYKLYAGVCAWPGGLSQRESSMAKARYFRWDEVRRIVAGCASRGRSGVYTFVTLVMSDGTVIPVPLTEPLRDTIDRVGQALRGVPFTYDNAARSRCAPEIAAQLATLSAR